MRFQRRPRSPYVVTDRKRLAAMRAQRRQREALPLLGPLIAASQPTIDAVMTRRVETWAVMEQAERDRRAGLWRRARRALDRDHDLPTRRALLEYWNGHRWLPGDPGYLLDMLHGFGRGRLVIVDGRVQAARVAITRAEADDSVASTKPIAGGWLGSRRSERATSHDAET